MLCNPDQHLPAPPALGLYKLDGCLSLLAPNPCYSCPDTLPHSSLCAPHHGSAAAPCAPGCQCPAVSLLPSPGCSDGEGPSCVSCLGRFSGVPGQPVAFSTRHELALRGAELYGCPCKHDPACKGSEVCAVTPQPAALERGHHSGLHVTQTLTLLFPRGSRDAPCVWSLLGAHCPAWPGSMAMPPTLTCKAALPPQQGP